MRGESLVPVDQSVFGIILALLTQHWIHICLGYLYSCGYNDLYLKLQKDNSTSDGMMGHYRGFSVDESTEPP